MITAQQKFITKKLRETGLTVKTLSKMTGIDKTRVWRIIATDKEMKLNEYLIFTNILRAKQLLTVDANSFLAGVE